MNLVASLAVLAYQGGIESTAKADVLNTTAESIRTVVDELEMIGNDTNTIAKDISAVVTDIGEIGNDTNTTAESISTVVDGLEMIGNDTNTIAKDISAVVTDIGEIGTDTNTIAKDISAVVTDVGEIGNDTNTIAKDISAVVTDIGEIGTDTNTIAKDISTVVADVNQNTITLTGIAETIDKNVVRAIVGGEDENGEFTPGIKQSAEAARKAASNADWASGQAKEAAEASAQASTDAKVAALASESSSIDAKAAAESAKAASEASEQASTNAKTAADLAKQAIDIALQAVKNTVFLILQSFAQTGSLLLRLDLDNVAATQEAVVGFRGGSDTGKVRAYDELGGELWTFDTFRRYSSVPTQTQNDIHVLLADDLLGDGLTKILALGGDQQFFPERFVALTTSGQIAKTGSEDMDYFHPGHVQKGKFFGKDGVRRLVFGGNSNAALYATLHTLLPAEYRVSDEDLATVLFGIDPSKLTGQGPLGGETGLDTHPASDSEGWYYLTLPWGFGDISEITKQSPDLNSNGTIENNEKDLIALSHNCGYTFWLDMNGAIVDIGAHTALNPTCNGKRVGFIKVNVPNVFSLDIASFTFIQ